MTACIVGWDHLKFGKRPGEDIEDMIVSVASGAMKDAGVEPKDVDAIYLGTFGGGFISQEFPASLVLQAHPDLRFKPSTHVENACATGSAAIYQGINHIASKRARGRSRRRGGEDDRSFRRSARWYPVQGVLPA